MSSGSILVDTNAVETPLYTALVARFGDAQVKRQRLDVGDVVLTSAEGVSVLVERKTYADWGKSVTDGTPSKTVGAPLRRGSREHGRPRGRLCPQEQRDGKPRTRQEARGARHGHRLRDAPR
jgi:hypothetical protein